MEVWKRFHSIEVSNKGRVKTRLHPDGWEGVKSSQGYRKVSFKRGWNISIHRLVAHLFLDMELDDPRLIDHINGIRHDNRVENLRIVDSRENQFNRKTHREGRLVGVYFKKSHGKWSSSIKLDGKIHFIGLFDSELEGHTAYISALNNYKNYGIVPNVTSAETRLNKINPRSGCLYGATFNKQRQKWFSQIVIDGKKVYLGLFETEQEAHNAYIEKLGF